MTEIKAMYIRSDSLSREIYISYFYVCSLDSVSFSITQHSVLHNNLDDFAIKAIELLYRKALLDKLLLRSLQPGPELWKVLLRNRFDLWSPRNGGPWQANIWWLFSPALKEDRVVSAIMKAWSSLREGLVLMQPKMLDEQLRQPLFWNPRIRSEDGMMLGQQKYLPWGRMLGYKIRSVHD